MGDILFNIFMAGFATFFKFIAMMFVASLSATELPKTKNKVWRILKGIVYAFILSSLISFPRPSEDDYYDDRPPKTKKEQMNDFYKNFGSSLVVIFLGSHMFVYFTEEYRRRKNEEDQGEV